MSLLSVLLYIKRGSRLRKAYSLKSPGDAAHLELFSRILMGQQKSLSELLAALEKSILLEWEDVYDLVNPFGDRRGNAFDSMWTFDLDEDALFLTKKDCRYSVALRLARERTLTLNDFELVSSSPKEPRLEDEPLPGPYWEPKLHPDPRERSFLGKILEDFSYTWRHVIRRLMNTKTFMKLGYAIVWISQTKFTLLERTGFEHISDGGPYIRVVDLPGWETPDGALVLAGSSWFVLSQDIQEGLEMVRNHMKSQSEFSCAATSSVIYAILTLRRVVLCKASGDELLWTQSERLFDGTLTSSSDTAINMILWATSFSRTGAPQTRIDTLPVEVQDRILHHAYGSLVASAKLGCELGIGSTFSWLDQGVKIDIMESKRHRAESSPVESHILLNGVKSGLSYKRERGYPAFPSAPR